MNKNKLFFTSLMCGGICAMTSCVDDNYDLSDIDTTTAIKINNLTVPVRLNSIKLDDVLDIEEDGLISKFIDAEGNEFYAIQKGGDFSAEPFTIKPVVSKSGPLNGIDPITFGTLYIPEDGSLSLPMEQNVSFTYKLNDVDPAVKEVISMTMSPQAPLFINLTFEGMANTKIEDLRIHIPSMLVVENYTVKNEILEIPSMVSDGNGNLILPQPIRVNMLNINTENVFDQNNNTYEMSFEDYLGIAEGTIIGYQGTSVSPVAKFEMSGFTANRVTARIDYMVENPSIPDVDLGDIPDFLAEPETNLILSNPQLYIWVSNPTSLPVSSKLSLIPYREDIASYAREIELDFNKSVAMSPNPQASNLALYDEYAALGDGYATPIPFSGLTEILSGNGLPSSIRVNLDNTSISGILNEFVLGEDNGDEIKYNLEGKYTFFTPLAFGEGSQIIYQKKETDFFTEDNFEDVKVSHLQLSAYPTTNIPFSVELTIYPLNKQGERINGKNGYISASAIVPAYADGKTILDLNLNEEFTGLDGVEYIVKVDNLQGESLTPQQFVQLDNIRATLSGEYITKL